MASAGSSVINQWSVPLFGVPLTAIGMAAFGAYLSFAYTKPEKNVKKLIGLWAANTFLAVVCVAILPSWFGWEWANSRLEAPLAGLFAFSARYVAPQFIETIPEFLRKVLRLKEYNTKDTSTNDE